MVFGALDAVGGNVKNLSKVKNSKNWVKSKNPGFAKSEFIDRSTGTTFVTLKAKMVFTQLRKDFIDI